MKLVLDTDAYSDYAEGLPETVDFMATHGRHLYLPSVVLGKLNFGFMKSSRQQLNERKLQQFISRLRVEIIDVNADVARKYAIIYLSLQNKGGSAEITIRAEPMISAAIMIEKDMRLLIHREGQSIVCALAPSTRLYSPDLLRFLDFLSALFFLFCCLGGTLFDPNAPTATITFFVSHVYHLLSVFVLLAKRLFTEAKGLHASGGLKFRNTP